MDSVSKETTPFNQIFGGYIRQEVTCLRCKHVSTTYQRFMDILVEIQQANTIEDALVQFFKQKRLGQPGDPASLYKCEKCKFKFCVLVNYLTIVRKSSYQFWKWIGLDNKKESCVYVVAISFPHSKKSNLGKTRSNGFRSMIASLQFNNLNLQFGNFQLYQFWNMAIFDFGNLVEMQQPNTIEILVHFFK